ncbi:MAG: RNA-binding protein [Acidimicrobiales bacterium]|nr:RNA-binding protein [Acidimicrobiales bacterium]
MTAWILDGNNIMGSRPDKWWNDRPAAMERLGQEIAHWCWTHDDTVHLVFDGPHLSNVDALAGGNLRIEFAQRSARNAADDVIVELAHTLDGADVTVVSADKGLKERLREGIKTEGPGSFLRRLST